MWPGNYDLKYMIGIVIFFEKTLEVRKILNTISCDIWTGSLFCITLDILFPTFLYRTFKYGRHVNNMI